MLTATQIAEYNIDFTLDRYSLEMEHLFSGVPGKDPEFEALSSLSDYGYKYWDLVFAFGGSKFDTQKGMFDRTLYRRNHPSVVTQIIVFRTKEGYDKYMKDKPLIFDEKEI